MRLDEYIKAIEECHDEILIEGRDNPEMRITAEYGVHDNWPIFLFADFDKVIKDLNDSVNSDVFFSGEYRQKYLRDLDEGSRKGYFEYIPGTVTMQVKNYVGYGLFRDVPDLVHYQKQKRDFNMSFILHPYQKKEIENVSGYEAIAKVSADIGRYALKEGISLCFPRSSGSDNLRDVSRIVYFDPKDKNC